MIWLHIIAEGQTEQNFAKRILMPHLANFNVFVDARCVLTSKDKRTSKKYTGGLPSECTGLNLPRSFEPLQSAKE